MMLRGLLRTAVCFRGDDRVGGPVAVAILLEYVDFTPILIGLARKRANYRQLGNQV